MRKMFVGFILTLALGNCLSCTQNNLVVSNAASKTTVAAAMTTTTNSNGNLTAALPTEKAENKKSSKPVVADDSLLNDAELQEQITNNLGGLIVATFYQPHFIEGDFNGDQLMDAAIVVGAEDRFGKPGEIGDLFAGLPFIVEGVSFQNLRSNGILLAQPKQSAIDLERNKTKLKARSKLGLLIILSHTANWSSELSKTDYDRKFILLDALFGPEIENKEDQTEWLSIVKPGENCLPTMAKGEGIFSGDAESAGKVIYFNGQKFAWEQCGD